MSKLGHSFLSALVLACISLSSLSCSSVDIYPSRGKRIGQGPPAHAPAHGYRKKCPDGIEVRYDSAHGVYVVTGYRHHYYVDGQYYRLHDDAWQVSVRISGVWKPVEDEALPPGLRTKVGKRHASKVRLGRAYGMAKKADW